MSAVQGELDFWDFLKGVGSIVLTGAVVGVVLLMARAWVKNVVLEAVHEHEYEYVHEPFVPQFILKKETK